MKLWIEAGNPIPPPPGFWDEVNRLAALLLPTAVAWIVSVAIALWLWFKFLRDQSRRAIQIRRAIAGYLDEMPAAEFASRTVITVTVAVLQLAWLFLTWVFAMIVTWLFDLEQQADALQWNGWTAAYLLGCGSILTASYAAAFGAFEPQRRAAYRDRGREFIHRLCWPPLIMPAIVFIISVLILALIGLISLMPGIHKTHDSLVAGLFLLLGSVGYAAASWGAVVAPLLVQRTWQRAHALSR